MLCWHMDKMIRSGFERYTVTALRARLSFRRNKRAAGLGLSRPVFINNAQLHDPRLSFDNSSGFAF